MATTCIDIFTSRRQTIGKSNVTKCHSMRATPTVHFTSKLWKMFNPQKALYITTTENMVWGQTFQSDIFSNATMSRWTCRRWRNTSKVGGIRDGLQCPAVEARRDLSLYIIILHLRCAFNLLNTSLFINRWPYHHLRLSVLHCKVVISLLLVYARFVSGPCLGSLSILHVTSILLRRRES